MSVAATRSDMPSVRVDDLVVEYRTGDYPVRVLDHLDLTAIKTAVAVVVIS